MPSPRSSHPFLSMLTGLTALALTIAAPRSATAGGASLDPSFGDGGLTTVALFDSGSTTPRALLLSDAGEIYLGGEVISRYTSDGTVDASFGDAGSAYHNIRFNSLALQPDGKVLGAGITTLGFSITIAVVRLLSDGSLDADFGTGGRFELDFASEDPDMALLSDGRIVVVGNDLTTRNTVALRLLADGTLDSAFSGDGIVVDELSTGDNAASAVAALDNGKILVAGFGDAQNPPDPACFGETDAFVVRYNSDGTRDSGFADAGVSWIDVSGCADMAMDLAVKADGKIVVGGYSEIVRLGDFDEDIVVTQLLATGAVDNDFGTAGSTNVDFDGGDDQLLRLALQADGSVVATGEIDPDAGSEVAVLRFSNDGSLDTSFGTQGTVIIGGQDSSDSPCCVALTATQRAVVAFRTFKSSSGTNTDFGMTRLLTDGSVDTTFGDQGLAIDDFVLQQQLFSTDLLEAADGKIYQIGYASRFAVARYNADGTIDETFGDSGIVATDFGVGSEFARGAVVQSDGKLVAAGDNNGNFLLARYLANGDLDPAFGVGGMVAIDVGFPVRAGDVGIQSDGKFVVVGFNTSGNFDFVLARYDTQGALDATFGTAGITRADRNGDADVANALTILSDDRVVVAGSSAGTGSDFALARFTANGALDTSFGVAGWTVTDFSGFNDGASSVAELSDGSLVAVGETRTGSSLATADFGIAHYSADGGINTVFGTDGKASLDLGLIEAASAVAQASDGTIYVVGTGSPGSIVARFTSDGSLDTDFADSGIAMFALGGTEVGTGLIAQSNRVIVGGHALVDQLIGVTPQEFLVRAVLAGGCSLCGHGTDANLCGNPVASDALAALQAAVGLITCDLCRCDVNSSGSTTATDALTILQRAVGQNVALTCIACS